MREEFHGLRNAENVITALKQLYGWGTISANVWLPSLSELVGTTGTVHPNTGVYKSAMKGLNTSTNYHDERGCYFSAMQGLNLSGNAWTDVQGGNQFAYFQQYNTLGGGEKIWNACGEQKSWLRSAVYSYSDRANAFNSTDGVWHVPSLKQLLAVHPAVSSEQVVCHLLIPNERNPKQINGLLYQSFWIV